jgi:hypothetical protein
MPGLPWAFFSWFNFSGQPPELLEKELNMKKKTITTNLSS